MQTVDLAILLVSALLAPALATATPVPDFPPGQPPKIPHSDIGGGPGGGNPLLTFLPGIN